jgi:hypothetical protein
MKNVKSIREPTPRARKRACGSFWAARMPENRRGAKNPNGQTRKMSPAQRPHFQNRKMYAENSVEYRQKFPKCGKAGIDNKESTVL